MDAGWQSDRDFAARQVSLLNTLGKLGREGFGAFDLAADCADRRSRFGSRFSACIYCAEAFDSPATLHRHVRDEHRRARGGDEDEDDDCAKAKARARARSKSDLEIELKGPFVCNSCDRVFEECCVFSVHVDDAHSKRRRSIHRCQICERRFARKEEAQALPELLCDACDESFDLQARLDSHRKKYHSKAKPFGCSLCAKRFSQSAGLSQHMKTHSGIKPYRCGVCPKAFRQKAGLDQHARIHSNTKPYSCLLCGRAFTQSAHLSQHMRIHTKIEPYECASCDRRFKQSSHLNFHMRSHNPEFNASKEYHFASAPPR